MRITMKITTKSLVTIALLLLLTGCVQVRYAYRQWDSAGNLVGKEDITYNAAFVPTKTTGLDIKLHNGAGLTVGNRQTFSDPNGMKAFGQAVGQVISESLKGGVE